MSHSQLEYLRHIYHETDYLISHSFGLKKEDFLVDHTLQRAFVRSIEIIGEASKKVSPDVKHNHY
jgi:uncharacterized protein with HEPN domain